MRTLLSLANALATQCELLKSVWLDFIENRVLFVLDLLIAEVPRGPPRSRPLSVEVSVHENKHRALEWIFAGDAPLVRDFNQVTRLDISVS